MATKSLCTVEGCGKPSLASGWCRKHYFELRDTPKCKVEGCDRPQVSLGFCSPHVARFRRHGDPLGGRGENSDGKCIVEGCGRKHFGRGYCNAHYRRWRAHGDPFGGGSELSPAGEPLRWMREHLSFDGPDCLVWPFARHTNGYGLLRDEDGRRIGAHRWACEQVNGPPPTSDHQAAHNCGKGRLGCVHPKHLRWATPAENTADKYKHGTMKFGNRNHAKLTEEQIRKIRSLQGKLSQSKIGRIFGISQSHVGRIHHREIWGDVV